MSDEINIKGESLEGEEIVEEVSISIDVTKEREKPRLISLLFCDFYSNTEDKKANLLGVFDRVFVHPKNNLTPRFVVFIRTAETHRGQLIITIIAPNNKGIAEYTSSLVTEPQIAELPVNVQTMFYVQFNALIEGVYWFDVSYQGESLGGAPLVVEYREAKGIKRGTDTYP